MGIETNEHYEYNGLLKSTNSGYQGGAEFRDLEYRYDINNNVKKRTDNHLGIVQDYKYDSLDRVVSAIALGTNLPYEISLIYQYDEIGNIRYKSDIETYTYSPTKLH